MFVQNVNFNDDLKIFNFKLIMFVKNNFIFTIFVSKQIWRLILTKLFKFTPLKIVINFCYTVHIFNGDKKLVHAVKLNCEIIVEWATSPMLP